MTKFKVLLAIIIIFCTGTLIALCIAKWFEGHKIKVTPNRLTNMEWNLLNQFLDCGYTEIESSKYSELVWLIGPGKNEAIFSKSFKLFEWLDEKKSIKELLALSEVKSDAKI